MKKTWIVYSLILILLSCGSSIQQDTIDLGGSDWSITKRDDSTFALPDVDHSTWETVSLPGNLRSFAEKDHYIWIRKTFENSFRETPKSYSLLLGKVYSEEEIYINGTLIGSNGINASELRENPKNRFGTERIYHVPSNILKQGENLVAIRIKSGLWNILGILTGPIQIRETKLVEITKIQRDISHLIIIGFLSFLSLYYFLQFFIIKDKREFLSFGVLTLFFAIFEFSKNDIRFQILDNFLFFKILSYTALVFITPIYLSFLYRFHNLTPTRNVRFFYLAASLMTVFFLINRNPTTLFNVIGILDLMIPFVIGYSAYFSFVNLQKSPKGGIIHLFSQILLFILVLIEALTQRGFIIVNINLGLGFFIYSLSVSFIFQFRYVLQSIELESRKNKLSEGDRLRERVFLYLNSYLRGPLLRLSESFLEKSNDPTALKTDFQNIEDQLEDVLEISRLEVMTEVTHLESLEVKPYLESLLLDSGITYSVMVRENTMINTSPDLFNSIVVRILEFPPLKALKHRDLIITEDLNHFLHFRFLLYNDNLQTTLLYYNELTSQEILEKPYLLRWSIVKEIIRLLKGKLEVSLIKKKYLRIDIGIPGILQESKITEEKSLSIAKRLEMTSLLPGLRKIFTRKPASEAAKPSSTTSVKKQGLSGFFARLFKISK